MNAYNVYECRVCERIHEKKNQAKSCCADLMEVYQCNICGSTYEYKEDAFQCGCFDENVISLFQCENCIETYKNRDEAENCCAGVNDAD